MTYRSKSCPPTPWPSRRAERQADMNPAVMAVGNAAAPSTRDPDPYLLRFRDACPGALALNWEHGRVAWGHGRDGDEPCLALPARALRYATPTASARLLPPPGRLLLSCFLDLARHPSPRRRRLLFFFSAPRRPRPLLTALCTLPYTTTCFLIRHGGKCVFECYPYGGAAV